MIANNYRPISLFLMLGKVLKLLVAERIAYLHQQIVGVPRSWRPPGELLEASWRSWQDFDFPGRPDRPDRLLAGSWQEATILVRFWQELTILMRS